MNCFFSCDLLTVDPRKHVFATDASRHHRHCAKLARSFASVARLFLVLLSCVLPIRAHGQPHEQDSHAEQQRSMSNAQSKDRAMSSWVACDGEAWVGIDEVQAA